VNKFEHSNNCCEDAEPSRVHGVSVSAPQGPLGIKRSYEFVVQHKGMHLGQFKKIKMRVYRRLRPYTQGQCDLTLLIDLTALLEYIIGHEPINLDGLLKPEQNPAKVRPWVPLPCARPEHLAKCWCLIPVAILLSPSPLIPSITCGLGFPAIAGRYSDIYMSS
jgi:hypothetical protein